MGKSPNVLCVPSVFRAPRRSIPTIYLQCIHTGVVWLVDNVMKIGETEISDACSSPAACRGVVVPQCCCCRDSGGCHGRATMGRGGPRLRGTLSATTLGSDRRDHYRWV